jgi:hypothetical protein
MRPLGASPSSHCRRIHLVPPCAATPGRRIPCLPAPLLPSANRVSLTSNVERADGSRDRASGDPGGWFSCVAEIIRRSASLPNTKNADVHPAAFHPRPFPTAHARSCLARLRAFRWADTATTLPPCRFFHEAVRHRIRLAEKTWGYRGPRSCLLRRLEDSMGCRGSTHRAGSVREEMHGRAKGGAGNPAPPFSIHHPACRSAVATRWGRLLRLLLGRLGKLRRRRCAAGDKYHRKQHRRGDQPCFADHGVPPRARCVPSLTEPYPCRPGTFPPWTSAAPNCTRSRFPQPSTTVRSVEFTTTAW